MDRKRVWNSFGWHSPTLLRCRVSVMGRECGEVRCNNIHVKDWMDRQHWALCLFEWRFRFHGRATDRAWNLTQESVQQVKPSSERKDPALIATLYLQSNRDGKNVLYQELQTLISLYIYCCSNVIERERIIRKRKSKTAVGVFILTAKLGRFMCG